MRQRLITLSAGTKFVEKLGMRALTTEHNTHPTLVKHLVSSAYPQHMGEICCPHDGEFPLLRALFGMSRDERLLVFLLVGDKTSKGADRIDEWYKSHVATAENLFRIELQKLSSVPKDD